MRTTIDHPRGVLAALKDYAGVVGVSQRSEAFALVASPTRTRGVMIMGVDPSLEPSVSTLAGQIRKGRYFKSRDDNQALVGTLLAERLRVSIGDELTVLGQGRDGSIAATVLTIVGIYQAGIDAFDRSTLQMPLDTFNEVFFMEGSVHRVVVQTDRLATATKLQSFLRNQAALKPFAVLTWDELMPGLRQSIELDLVSGIIMYVILVIVVAFSILNTFFMAIFERTREFGVLMAIGTKPGRLVQLMLLESMAITTVGILTGMLLGSGLTLFFAQHGIPLGESAEILAQYGISGRIYPRLSWLSLLAGPSVVLIITLATALIPALKIPRLQPVEAMRAV
jgi:ABC-type lipoprotein release transport system permease subunit